MKKPQLHKSLVNDMIIKSLENSLKDNDFVKYFEQFNISIMGIEGFGLRKGKKEGLIISFKDLTNDTIKHAEIKTAIKTELYELFDEYIDYDTQVKTYESFTGEIVNNIEKNKAKNKKTYNFETLANNITEKVNVNKLASEILE